MSLYLPDCGSLFQVADGSGLKPDSRPLTADETRRLQREWIKKYDPGSSDEDEEEEEVSQYDNVRRAR